MPSVQGTGTMDMPAGEHKTLQQRPVCPAQLHRARQRGRQVDHTATQQTAQAAAPTGCARQVLSLAEAGRAQDMWARAMCGLHLFFFFFF